MEDERPMDWRTAFAEAAEVLGWSASFYGDGTCELETCSDAGEDFSFAANATSAAALARDVAAYWADFDPEEHAVSWYGANRGEPPSLRRLLEDADGIAARLEDLAVAFARL